MSAQLHHDYVPSGHKPLEGVIRRRWRLDGYAAPPLLRPRLRIRPHSALWNPSSRMKATDGNIRLDMTPASFTCERLRRPQHKHLCHDHNKPTYQMTKKNIYTCKLHMRVPNQIEIEIYLRSVGGGSVTRTETRQKGKWWHSRTDEEAAEALESE